MTQEKIAKQLGMNRLKIHRYLEAAKEEGIVQILVINPLSHVAELESFIKQKYRLEEIIVVPALTKNEYFIRKSLARSASKYLSENIHDGDCIGIGWGKTMYETLKYFQSSRKISATVVPLIGGIGQYAADFQVNEMARQFSEKINGEFVPLYAPAIVDSESIVKALFSDKNFEKVSKLWERLDIAIVGIGGPIAKDTYLPDTSLSDNDLKILINKGHVGDILFNNFDKNGKVCNESLTKKRVGISFEQLKKAKKIIAIAGSLRKKEAILASLKSGYVDVLITDQIVAKELAGNEQ
jgi:DNA-binding transcriptional regulator LsrR (DeoR family)